MIPTERRHEASRRAERENDMTINTRIAEVTDLVEMRPALARHQQAAGLIVHGNAIEDEGVDEDRRIGIEAGPFDCGCDPGRPFIGQQ